MTRYYAADRYLIYDFFAFMQDKSLNNILWNGVRRKPVQSRDHQGADQYHCPLAYARGSVCPASVCTRKSLI